VSEGIEPPYKKREGQLSKRKATKKNALAPPQDLEKPEAQAEGPGQMPMAKPKVSGPPPTSATPDRI